MAGSAYAFETVEDKEAKALKNEEKKLDLLKRKLELDKEEFEWELEKEKKTQAGGQSGGPHSQVSATDGLGCTNWLCWRSTPTASVNNSKL